MEQLEEGIGDSVRPNNKFESQGESIQDSCKTNNDVRCRDVGSEESTREEVGWAEMRMLRWISGVIKLDRIRNERIKGTTKVGEISNKVLESRLNWYGHVSRRRIRREVSDWYGGAGETKEMKTKAEVVGWHQERLVGEGVVRGGRAWPA